MQEAALYWIGTHDFSSFRASECQSLSPLRKVFSIRVGRVGDLIFLDFHANAFLHHMVRNMVGVLSEIGGGFLPPEAALEILKARDRKVASVTASAFGLYLVEVQYPESFEIPRADKEPWFLKMSEESNIL